MFRNRASNEHGRLPGGIASSRSALLEVHDGPRDRSSRSALLEVHDGPIQRHTVSQVVDLSYPRRAGTRALPRQVHFSPF